MEEQTLCISFLQTTYLNLPQSCCNQSRNSARSGIQAVRFSETIICVVCSRFFKSLTSPLEQDPADIEKTGIGSYMAEWVVSETGCTSSVQTFSSHLEGVRTYSVPQQKYSKRKVGHNALYLKIRFEPLLPSASWSLTRHNVTWCLKITLTAAPYMTSSMQTQLEQLKILWKKHLLV